MSLSIIDWLGTTSSAWPVLLKALLEIVILIIWTIGISHIARWQTNKILEKEHGMAESIRKHGVDHISVADGKKKGGYFPKDDMKKIFGLRGQPCPLTLDICFMTGGYFFEECLFQKKYMENILRNGCQVRILLADPGISGAELLVQKNEKSDYYAGRAEELIRMETDPVCYRNASFLARATAMLRTQKNTEELTAEMKRRGETREQVLKVEKKVSELRTMLEMLRKTGAVCGTIGLRYYIDEYRIPVTVMTRNGRFTESFFSRIFGRPRPGRQQTFGWTNLTMPVREASDSVQIRFAENEYGPENPFIRGMEDSFDYIWERARDPFEEMPGSPFHKEKESDPMLQEEEPCTTEAAMRYTEILTDSIYRI